MKHPIDWTQLPPTALVRQRDLLPVLPFAASTLWRRIAAGQFPRPVHLEGRISAWRVGDVLQWLDAPGGRGDK